MTEEEHQSVLKVAVSYAIEETRRVCFAEMDKAMAELTEQHITKAKEFIKAAAASERAAIVAWLRGPEPYPDGNDIADEIEAGAHHP